MPIAFNPETRQAHFLNDAGEWEPAQTAVNPQTKEIHVFDGKDWVSPLPKTRGVGMLADDMVRSLAQGATMGFADEIAAGMNTLPGVGTGKSYEENLAAEQERNKEIPAGIRIPGEIGGAVAGSVAAAPVTGAVGAATGFSRLPAWARGPITGALGGAGFGAGEAQPGQRLEGAGTGAAIGFGTGAAMSPVSALVSGVRGAITPQANVTADFARALKRDKVTPEEFLAQFEAAQNTRPGVAAPADVGGENVRGLVERIAQTPGAGRSTVVPFLTTRQQGQLVRFSNDLADLTGTRRTAFQAVEDTMAQRKEAASPLYVQTYADGDHAIWSPELERLSSAPSVLSALRSAQSKWKDWQVVDGFGAANPPVQIERGGLLKFTGGNGVPTYPNLQFWDYAARELRDKASEAYQAGKGELYRRYNGLERQLTAELDKIVPSYAAARNAWAGPSRFLDAIEEGRNIFSTKISGEELSAAVGAMSEAEREGFRIGAVSAIRGKMGNDPAKMADMTKYLRSPEMREKVAALMPDDAAKQSWQQRLDFEVGLSELSGKALGNSATPRRLAEQADAEGIVGDLVMGVFAGHPPVSLLRQAVGVIPRKMRDTMRSRSDDILAELLTDPQSMAGLRAAMERVQSRQAAPPSVLRSAVTRGVTAGVVGE